MNKLSFTSASVANRTPLRSNKFAWLLFSLFIAYWIYGWFNCLLLSDWIMENLLVVICISFLVASHKWHRLSDLSYLFIFVYVMLHLYGAFYAYSHNYFGEWLQNSYQLVRNPYDRIVHFSFGLLLAYPYREILMNRYGLSGRGSWLYPIEIAFSLGTIFEMIEWGVSVSTDSATGDTYVATQGDVWDAHKDIILAAIGAATTMLLLYAYKKVNGKRKNVAGR